MNAKSKTLVLRGQAVVDETPVAVMVEVTRDLWVDSELARDVARDKVRTGLRDAVAERTGRQLPSDAFNETPVWVEYPDQCTLECVDGPMVGYRVTVGTATPPPWIKIDPPGPPAPEDRPAVYVGAMDERGHFFSRTADGAWRYTYMLLEGAETT
jgi:hypothetical protein